MTDLSLHILDIAENSLTAGATQIGIVVLEDTARDALLLEISDDGRGMDDSEVAHVADPFYTTRTTRRVGLGIPLLKVAALEANGDLDVRSAPGQGTTIVARFQHSHIDRKPLGDVADTLVALLAARPDLDLSYRHVRNGRSVQFSTDDVRPHLDGLPLNAPSALTFVREFVRRREEELLTTA
jgi:hypothetical protein